jgi:hypothetical protein
MIPRWVKEVVAIIAILLGVFFLGSCWGQRRTDTKATKAEAGADSAIVQHDTTEARLRRDSTYRAGEAVKIAAAFDRAEKLTAEVGKAKAAAATAQKKAEDLASSAAAAKTAADSAEAWRLAYVSRTEEADRLRGAVALAERQRDSLRLLFLGADVLRDKAEGAAADARRDAANLSAKLLELRRHPPSGKRCGFGAGGGLGAVARQREKDDARAPVPHALGGATVLVGYVCRV